jgi:soluble lytic murein transglycosylase-like protein
MKKLFVMILATALSGCAVVPEIDTIDKSSKLVEKADLNVVNLVTFKAVEYNIPVKFAHAVVHVESRYHPNVRHNGAYGLGQIKCQTAKGIGFKGDCKKLLDPETNLDYSFKYLRMALDIAKDNECHAASLYQSGLGNRPRASAYCKLVMNRKNQF